MPHRILDLRPGVFPLSSALGEAQHEQVIAHTIPEFAGVDLAAPHAAFAVAGQKGGEPCVCGEQYLYDIAEFPDPPSRSPPADAEPVKSRAENNAITRGKRQNESHMGNPCEGKGWGDMQMPGEIAATSVRLQRDRLAVGWYAGSGRGAERSAELLVTDSFDTVAGIGDYLSPSYASTFESLPG